MALAREKKRKEGGKNKGEMKENEEGKGNGRKKRGNERKMKEKQKRNEKRGIITKKQKILIWFDFFKILCEIICDGFLEKSDD